MNESAPTVLVIDDDPAILKALERLLRSIDLNVATFASPLLVMIFDIAGGVLAIEHLDFRWDHTRQISS